MDSLSLSCSILCLVLILFKDVSSFTLSVSKSADKAILGDNPFTLSCQYTLASNEQLYSIELQRKRDSDSSEAFDRIITFQNPNSPLNVTYQDKSLPNRTVATNPTAESRTATLQFNKVECDDKATYRWNAFYTDGTNKNVLETVSVIVRANTLFETDGTLTFIPSTNIEENDTVTFTCTGDVGNEPVGHLGWFYYLGNDTSVPINASDKATTQAPVYSPSTCSYRRTSTLQLKMTKLFNNILVRCTVQQDHFNQFGDGHKQTKNIPVYYSPKITSIDDKTISEGYETWTISCVADANPPPNYSWFLPNGTEIMGQTLTLSNIEIGDNGTYTCSVYNTYKQTNHTANETFFLDVRETTTPAPTTTPQPTTGPTGGDGTTVAQVRDDDKGNDQALAIGLGVGIGLVAIIVIVVVVLCIMKKRKPKEIEEPPEKPRNNQDLSFYGNRPDLVSADHGMKNNMGGSALNSSFNSYDSTSDIKSRNDEGLFDIQFDDKPRSRRPIQLLDNMLAGDSYSDIVNPRV